MEPFGKCPGCGRNMSQWEEEKQMQHLSKCTRFQKKQHQIADSDDWYGEQPFNGSNESKHQHDASGPPTRRLHLPLKDLPLRSEFEANRRKKATRNRPTEWMAQAIQQTQPSSRQQQVPFYPPNNHSPRQHAQQAVPFYPPSNHSPRQQAQQVPFYPQTHDAPTRYSDPNAQAVQVPYENPFYYSQPDSPRYNQVQQTNQPNERTIQPNGPMVQKVSQSNGPALQKSSRPKSPNRPQKTQERKTSLPPDQSSNLEQKTSRPLTSQTSNEPHVIKIHETDIKVVRPTSLSTPIDGKRNPVDSSSTSKLMTPVVTPPVQNEPVEPKQSQPSDKVVRKSIEPAIKPVLLAKRYNDPWTERYTKQWSKPIDLDPQLVPLIEQKQRNNNKNSKNSALGGWYSIRPTHNPPIQLIQL